MSKSLLLTKDIPFCIYGAGEVGRLFASRAKKNKYNLICFFDKNLVGSVYDGLPVLDFHAPLPDNIDKSHVAVIICLADGLQHTEVANTLYTEGFNHIILLPMGFHLPPKKSDALTILYNKILNITQTNQYLLIEDYAEICKTDFDSEQIIIRKENERITLLVDSEIIFTEDYSRWPGDHKKIHSDILYSGINISMYKAYFSLFDYISGTSDNYNDYIALFQRNLENFHINISERGQLFEIFSRELERGIGFFVEAAPDAMWHEKGHFNLIGGHHRTSFLYHRNHRLLPVRIISDDFERWVNRPQLENVLAILNKQNITSLYAPLPHPAFRYFHARRETYLPSVFSALGRYLGADGLVGRTVFDLCDDNGYFARILYRAKSGGVTAFAPNEKEAMLTSALNNLLYLSEIRVEVGIPNTGKCDFLVLMDRCAGLPPSEREEFAIIASSLSRDLLLWESPAEDFPVDSEILARQGFARCDILLNLVLNGDRHTVAIFRKSS